MGAAFSAQLAACPRATRLLAALYVIASTGVPALAGWNPRLQLSFLCSLATVVDRGHWAPLFFSTIYRPLRGTTDLVMALAELHMAVAHCPNFEKSLGSLRFLVWAFLSTGGTNAVFLLLMKLLSPLGVCGTRFFVNQGLWPLILVGATTSALQGPNVPINLLGLVDVPSKWYPLSLGIGLSALHGSVQWETFAAVAFGYAYGMLRLEERLLLSRRRARDLEERWIPNLPGLLGAVLGGSWIPADPRPPAGGGRRDSWMAVARRGAGNGGIGAGEGFQLFGGQGHRLGD